MPTILTDRYYSDKEFKSLTEHEKNKRLESGEFVSVGELSTKKVSYPNRATDDINSHSAVRVIVRPPYKLYLEPQ